jgi:hypothetical protein
MITMADFAENGRDHGHPVAPRSQIAMITNG